HRSTSNPRRSTHFPYTTLFRSRSRRTTRRIACTSPRYGTSARRGGSSRCRTSCTRTTATALSPTRQTCSISTRAAAVVLEQLVRSEEHTSELQSLAYLVCRLLL